MTTDRPRGHHIDGEAGDVLRDPDRLARLYSTHGTMRGVAGQLGVSAATVRYWLVKHGLPTNKRGTYRLSGYAGERLADRLWVYRAYVRDKRTCEDIGIELGCSVQTVANTLARYGITTRPTGNYATGRAAAKLADAEWLHDQVHVERRTYRNIADELEVSAATIENYLDRHGIPRSSARITVTPIAADPLDDEQVA